MAINRFRKRILKITGILLGILLVLLVGFHFWFKAHALGLIEDMVESKSDGKLKLKVEKFRFNYFSRKIELEKAIIYNTDTLTGNTAYRFSVDKIKLQAKAILPIIFRKELLIDSLTLLSPHIQVTRLKANEKSAKTEKKDVSIPEEMGKVYSSIQDALRVLKVKRFQIDDGTFTLINKIVPDQLPVTITNLHFYIDNLEVDTSKLTGNEKLLFSDNIVLRSNNQNIVFPDGRHRISFSHFRINLEKKLVEFDSCTIAATKGDSASATFDVFFDKLKLTNIDFDTLYKSEVIKADSVYCVNPKFNLTVNRDIKKGSDKPPPKLEDIIQQLTGNLQLGFVVVTNADFNINTVKNGKPSSFTFSDNNFEMQGLSIDQDAPKPLKVKSFAMAIRNYENFIKDSTYRLQFDSILFRGDQITLSNFIFHKLDNGKILNTFSIPQFNLRGLSWDELVFERKLKAEQAIMFSPYISYTASASKPQKRGKQNIFQSLSAINDYMNLQNLIVVDGTIDLKLKNDLRVQMENATVSVQSNSLLTSTKFSGIKNSLTNLNFKKGVIRAGDMTVELNDIEYLGTSGQFAAGSINVKSRTKNIAIDLQQVEVDKMQLDEASGNIFADGVKWVNGNVTIKSLGGKKSSNDGSTIELKNVRGGNTSVNAVMAGKVISTKLADISFNELIKKPGSKLRLDGLSVTGRQLQVKDNKLNFSVADYDITDNSRSSFRQIVYKSNDGKVDAAISIPLLTVTPHIQPLLNGEIALDALDMANPVINLHLTTKKTTDSVKKASLPKIDISELKITQPKINFTQVSDSGTLSLDWHGERNSANFLLMNGININSGITSLSNLKFYLTDFVFSDTKGKTFTTGDGKVSAQLKNIGFEQKVNKQPEWKAIVSSFDAREFQLDSIGKSQANLVMNTGTISNLNISSANITDFQKLAAANTAFQIKQLTGSYSTASTKLKWYNADYNRNNNTFSLDSFSFKPALEKDSFLATKTYQTDYITVETGSIRVGPVDMDLFIKENKLNIGTASITDLVFVDYKDKNFPFNPGIIKPLPVNLLKKIPQQLSIGTILLNNAYVEYTEVSEKTKKAGTIPITRMNVRIANAKNYNINPTDSLSVMATAYLMDTAWINLRLKESYTDSLGGFLMTLRLKPADLTILNPVLIPLVSAKLESGFLDTLSMRAVGREYLALGDMEMLYHDLKVSLLKKSDDSRKGLLTALVNLVVKNKNTSRKGKVFFIRQRDKSAINYLIKIAMSGMASSVGVKSNKKMIRKYKKELEERNLPPIDLE